MASCCCAGLISGNKRLVLVEMEKPKTETQGQGVNERD